MRAWVGVSLLGLLLWQGCGRNGLDAPFDLTPATAGASGAGGTGGAAGTGIAGHGGTSGAAGSGGQAGAGGLGGSVGVAGSLGSAGTGSFGGAGGVTGVGGVSGTAGSTQITCVPGSSEACACATGAQGAQVCRADGTYAACVCVSSEFQRVEDGMVGTWVGSDQSPWRDVFQVRLVFGADGHYSGHCAQASCPAPVFYYGSDDDSPVKTYELTDLQAGGAAVGTIQIHFDLGGSTNQGSLEALTLSADGKQLHFEFWATWGGRYGPIVFDLTRSM